MKKSSIVTWAVLAIIIATSGCVLESLEFEAGVKSPGQVNLAVDRREYPDLRLHCSNQPDLIIQSIADNISPRSPYDVFPFRVTIKNIGEGVATIKNLDADMVWWQAWQSRNGVTRDTPACFQSFIPGTIGVNQTKTAKEQPCGLEDLATYPYLIVDLDTRDDSVDCNRSNNTYVVQLAGVSILQ
jgi:hypothetical protein